MIKLNTPWVSKRVFWVIFISMVMVFLLIQSALVTSSDVVKFGVELSFFLILGYFFHRITLYYQSKSLPVSDISESFDHNHQIERIKALFQTLNQCNQAIIRSRNEQEVFSQICKFLVSVGGLNMAWIGIIEPNTKLVKPVAVFGEHSDYLDNVIISADVSNPLSSGPVGQAIHHDRPFWCQDLVHNSFGKHWNEQTRKLGWAVSASLPLHLNGDVIGVLSLYSSDISIFDAVGRELFLDIALNLDYAISNFDKEESRKQANQALRSSQEYLQAIIDNEPESVKTLDEKGFVLDINKLGLSLLEADSVRQINQFGLEYFIVPEYLAAFKQMHQRVIEGEKGVLEFEIVGLKGTRRWLETFSVPLNDSDNKPIVLSVSRDITIHKNSEISLKLASQVFENSLEGFVITDSDKKIISVNQSFVCLTGYSLEEIQGKNPSKILNSDLHDDSYFHRMWETINATGQWQGEIWGQRKNGEIYPQLISFTSIKDAIGNVTNFIGVLTDLSAIKASKQQLEFLAHHDSLTLLPNRILLFHRLQHGLDLSKRRNKLLAVMMLDLDRFKNVNDNFGHLAGDQLLQQVADRLTTRLRKMDTVARLGGDEFTVVLEDINEHENVARVAKAIIIDLSKPFFLTPYGEVNIGVSIGISLFPLHANTPEMLLQQADTALYQAKSQGRGRYAYFSDELTIAARKHLELEVRLRKAIAQNELCIYYQPQVDIETDQIVGAEALIRWHNPLGELMLPIDFIPIAEESSLILSIGEWVLREVCRQGKQWLDEGLPKLNLGVNLSAYQLRQSDLDALVHNILMETGFPPNNLELELTESALLEPRKDPVLILSKLRATGVRLAIDDFGIGYSSLSYLQRFPLDILKIDKSFIKNIPDDKDDMEIASTIIAIGNKLGLKVLAEGVETDEQLSFLIHQGCHFYQGYLKSEALPAVEFATLLSIQLNTTKNEI